ncbi:MAG: hypothetical protein JNK14_13855 [Chitinophagaceae bacterium]|nr:hypothetical protein [Chitinophagaceae bacterium]
MMKPYLPALLFFFLLSPSLAAQDIHALLNRLSSDSQKADTLFFFARKFKNTGKNDSVFYCMNLARSIALESGKALTIARYFTYRGNYLLMDGDYRNAVLELKQAFPYLADAANYTVHSGCLYSLMVSFTHLRQYDSAHHYYTMAEQLNMAHDPYRNWMLYAHKGRMFMEVNNFSQAEAYLMKGYTLTKARGIRMDHGVMLATLSELYSYARMPDQYAGVLKEQMELIAARKMAVSRIPSHEMIYADLEKMTLAEKVIFLQSVKTALLKNGDTVNAAFSNSVISRIHEDNGQALQALPYMKENMEWTKREGNLLNHFIYSKAAFRLLIKAAQYADAFAMSDYLFAVKDSLAGISQQEKMLELEARYQAEKKQKEIELLSSQNQLNEKEIEVLQTRNEISTIQLLRETEQRKALFRENLLKELAIENEQRSNALLHSRNRLTDSVLKSEKAYNELLARENQLKNSELKKEAALKDALDRENDMKAARLQKEKRTRWILIAGTGLLLVMGISVLALYRKQKAKNTLIQKQANELEVLMKEIHHRVKNNLQIVSSLLDLQSHTIADSQASEAVKEGKNRVQSMALIHQNLYSQGNIKGIKVKEYIHNLLRALCDSYNITNDKITIHMNIDDLNLDVDTMIPIGLVFNELVSNSFKYAFRDNRAGRLNIQLNEEGQQLLLKVSDNGVGFPEGLDVKSGKSFGLKMIRAFAQKLKAKLDIYNNQGAVVEMRISKFKMA